MYLSVYPFMYKVINLIIAPLFYVVVNSVAMYDTVIHGFDVDAGQILGMSNSEMFLIYLGMMDIMGEYNSIGCIYIKSEPFGKLVLTSFRHREYALGFAFFDIFRRFVYIVGSYTLPLIVIYLIRSEWSLGMVLLHLTYSILIFSVVELAVWISRYIRNSAYFGLLMGGYLCVSLPVYVLLMKYISEKNGFWSSLIVACAGAVLMGGLCIHSANVMMKKSVCDK